MTNYAAWDSFDVDHALDEVDQLQAIEEFAAKSDDILRRREKESLESIISATRKAADSLRSKAAVAALRDKRKCSRRKLQSSYLSANEKNGLASVTNLADNAVSLALELSTAMDKINKALISLLEKVNSLKISVKLSHKTRSFLFSDLRNGFNFLNDVQRFTTIRGKMDALVVRIEAFNCRIESLSTQLSQCNLTHPIEPDENSSKQNCEKNRMTSDDKDSEDFQVSKSSEMLNISSTLTILEVVSESVKNMMLFASRYIATVAIPLAEFSVSCDVSRYHLKLLEAQGQTGQGRSGSQAAKKADKSHDIGDAMVWILRGLSFAGLGSGYLANIHFRRVKQMYPEYPNINTLLEYLDNYELCHASLLGSETLEAAVIHELSRIQRRSKALSFEDENMFDINITAGITVMQINRFLGEGDDSDGMSPSTLNTFELGLHMGDRADLDPEDSIADSPGPSASSDVTICGICSVVDDAKRNAAISNVDETISNILKCHSSQCSVDIENRFEDMLSKSCLLKLSRRAFYEGQLLFLERLLYSAEIKYIAAYLLASAALKECLKTEEVTDTPEQAPADPVQRALRSYVLSIQSASLVNAALCRSHRSPRKCEDAPRATPGSGPLTGQSQSQSQPQVGSKSILSNEDSGVLQCKLLSTMSVMDLLDSSMQGSESLLLRSRRVSIFEKLQKFPEAIAELELMESFVANVTGKSSVASSETIGEKLNPEGIISSISGTFELFGFRATEFSQQNLFCGIISPMVSLDSVLDSIQGESFSSQADAQPVYQTNVPHHFISDLLKQITGKKNRMQFLQKRFG